MPTFSRKSKSRLYTCEEKLILLFEKVIEKRDCTILVGHRGKIAQNIAFYTGKSKLKYPKSKHNSFPSEAVDVIPYPFKNEDWKNLKKFKDFCNYVQMVADKMGIGVINGGLAWNWDFPHWQLK